MQTIYNLPAALQGDLDKLRQQTQRFRSGEISATEYRAFRVPQGVYEQRQDGTFMLRVRLPAGCMLPHQMRTVAAIARKFGSGRLHLTTRQEIQIHDVTLDGIHPALVELYTAAGLSTKGGGGNTVRNITACPDAGVCAREAFDVTPYAVAVTEFMLNDPLSFQMPRKYKIAFSGCPQDCIGSAVNDVGIVAKCGGNIPGFAVYAGGGMGPHPRVGRLLEEFVPADEIHLAAEAVKRVFDKHGNRKNKHRARLRYLVEDKGFEAFRALYAEELARLREEAPPALEVRQLGPIPTPSLHSGAASAPLRSLPGTGVDDGFDTWRARNVLDQKQEGNHLVHVPLFLGELVPETLEKLADVAEAHGEGMVRATPSQSLVLRWVSVAALPDLHAELTKLSLAASPPPVLRELIACTGAATCRLGVCLSQGMAEAVHGALDGHDNASDLDLHQAVDLRLYMNGCPNACGRHPLGSIALFGAARRVDGRLVPHYVVQLGGRAGEGKTRLAEGKEVLPARNVPAFLVEFLRTFRESAHYPSFDAFLESGGRGAAKEIAAKYKHVPAFTEDRNFYYDWGAEELFSFAGRGPGECSAGVFDLITVDLASAHEALGEGRLLDATALASRALLITQGEEANNSADALRLFEKHFVDAGLVADSFRDLITQARRNVADADTTEQFIADPQTVSELIAAVEDLYENMDQSLRFHPPRARQNETEDRDATKNRDATVRERGSAAPTVGAREDSRTSRESPTSSGSPDVPIDREADFQGVTCPLNYVKTKLLLGRMKTGQVLAVLLDEAGGRSVPESAEKDGHEVLSRKKQDGRWRVIIRKG